MSPLQKAAWFNLIVLGGTTVLYLAAVPLLAWTFDKPWSTVAVPATGVFGLCGLWGLDSLFFRPRRDGLPITDERDQAIQLRAWGAAMGTFWVLFVLAGVGSWAVMRYALHMQQVTVPVELFPGIVLAAMIVIFPVQSVVILHVYRTGETR